MYKTTQGERDRAQKKVEIVIDLVDMGFGCNDTERILEALRRPESDVMNGTRRQ